MRFSIFFIVSLLAGLAGCGGTSDGMQAVQGTVTFNGEPVEKGRILFRQTEGDRKAFSAEIVEGRYQLRAEPGPAVVEIRASRLIPGKFDNSNGTPEPVGEMYIPAKYNSRTELKADIAADGANEIPFELQDK